MSEESSAAHEPSAGELNVESCGPRSPSSPPAKDKDKDEDTAPEPDMLTIGLLAALVLLLGGRPEEAPPQPPEAPEQPPADDLPGLDTITLLGALLLAALSGRSGEANAEPPPAVTERVVARPAAAPTVGVPVVGIPVVPTLGPSGCPTWPGTSSNWVAATAGGGAVRIIR